MLIQIDIRDFATIDELQLSLSPGSTMITGETGAGKSIFIEAIELALGGRNAGSVIRPGKEKAEISLTFDITHFPKVTAYLKESDLYQDEPLCIIRRIIAQDGRSRCYVNGSPATLQCAKELGDLLFHLHGQHEQQVLLKADCQRDMLDRFGDHLALAHQVKKLAEQYRSLAQQIQAIREKETERTDRIEYLNYQLEELRTINLQAMEWEALEAEHLKLTHVDELLQLTQQVQQLLCVEQGFPLADLQDARKTLESIHHLEPKAISWVENLNSAIIQLADLESELTNYLENTELDPERLKQIEDRVSQVYSVSRKHKINPSGLHAFQVQLEAEFEKLNQNDILLSSLLDEQEKTRLEHKKLADELFTQRSKSAKKLEKIVTQTIRSLSLPHSEFTISLEKEEIVFLIKTNPDQSFQPLSKVISGGELSRLSLSMHLALAHRTHIPTLVFDEVDTGLSGATAEKIGKLLRKLGDSYQVFCVTHQPQVAACGHQQILVEKEYIAQSTYTRLRVLTETERTTEIARMLGGETITDKTLAHALEVLEVAQVLAGSV
ncbi:MAG TPA: DNA repair protein RecN [Gammaproteobacteria bacterium]|jgi:DNA repair protein RecN (Recombination protein N)|nr:DNA repair protein RecN [Gammaproteobacteria bacterium]